MEELFDGRYRQDKLLGRGAFSEVWKAYDELTKTYVALKIYESTANSGEDGEEMLTHEFALMINCSHTNLVCPKYYGKCDGKPYLTLPFSEKGNINGMIGKMNEEEAWKLLRDAASALAYLHAKHPPIIHQDIKPANILVGENGEYQLTDFGISTQVKATMSRVSVHDVERYTAGSLPYMAPEKFAGKKPTPAIDVWALGATVYEMLSGDLPFGNDGGLLQKKGMEVPELPEEKAFSSLLDETLDGCMHVDPTRRLSPKRVEEVANFALANPEARGISIDNVQGESSTISILHDRRSTDNNSDDTVVLFRNGEKKQKGDFVPTVKPTLQTEQVQSDGGKKNKGLWIVLAAAATVIVVVVVAIVLMKGGGNNDTEPVVAEMTDEMRLEQAKQMMLNAAEARQGWDSLVALSESGYSEATFLRSRLIFDNESPQYGLPEEKSWATMRNNVGLRADNLKAHRLLEEAEKQDKSNWKVLVELGYDYYKGKDRYSQYGVFADSVDKSEGYKYAYLAAALEYFRKAQPNCPDNSVRGLIEELETKMKQLNIRTR